MTAHKQIDALMAGEQLHLAKTCIAEALERTEPELLDQVERWRLSLRQVRLALMLGDEPTDELIFTVEDLLCEPCAAEARVAAELPLAHALRIRCFARKRCQELAREAVKAAHEALGEHPELLVAEGSSALEFDERQTARARYQRALELDPQHEAARLAMANLCYVEGDFAGARQQLERFEENTAGLHWGCAVRLRASVYAVQQDHQAEAAQWRRLVQQLPEGDSATSDRLALALALAAGGQREQALEQFRAAWRDDPDTPEGRYARERMEFLQGASPQTACKRLPAFPTTRQRWNYCGPAVLELCLKYLEIDLQQEEIAREVKRTTGTPMYEIVHYLRQRCVVARRIEATPQRLKAAIDLGLPVIVQEEYSTTSHVAVITGYDESLGMFIANDPMTHRQALRSFKWTERAGELFGNGGVIVLGRDGEQLQPLLARADEAGLVEARHLTLLDECDRRRPKPGSGEVEDATLQQVCELCLEALKLAPRFKLAWHRLWHAENMLYTRTGNSALREEVLARLHHVRTAFADDEWPHQLHGYWLMDCGRFEEAFICYFEASRRDPLDANNLEQMGECKWLAGDLADAEKYMLEALTLEPFHLRASENLAGIYLRQLEHVDRQAAAGEADAVERLTTMSPWTITRGIRRSPEQVSRRALHHSRVACSLAPDNPFNLEVAGALLIREQHHSECVELLRKARQVAPHRPYALWRLAQALEADGQGDEARTVLEEGCQRFWRDPHAWLALSGFRARCGDQQGAAATLEDGLGTLAEGHSKLVRDYFAVCRRLESAEAAAAKLRALTERRSGDEGLVREVAYLLDEEGQRGHAVALLRHVVSMAPSDVGALYRLGVLLSEDTLSRAEGRAALEQVIRLAPDATAPRRLLAWLCLADDPRAGLELLEPVQDREDPYVLETRSALLAALGHQQQAQESFERALEAMGAPGPGLVDLCYWHIDGMRYQRALELARQIFEHPLPDETRADAEDCWIAAHRMSGAIREGLPRIRQMCADGVPDHLAWEVYWALRSIDHGLAAEAAECHAAQLEDGDQALLWRIKAAGKRAHLGHEEPLQQVREQAGQQARAWAELSWVYEDLKRYDDSNAAARRAHELDPDDNEALTAMETAHLRQSDTEAALACARRLNELYPYEHQGPERLGILLAKMFQTDEALEQSLRALDAAPFCHISQRSRAVALFADGQLEQAAQHARQSLALDEPEEQDEGDDALMILRAVSGDLAGLQRCLATLGQQEPPEVFERYKEYLVKVATEVS